MSYILDALKKSGQERQHETLPHLQSLHHTPPSFKGTSVSRSRRWPWLLFSAVLIFGGLWKWSDWNRQGPAEQHSQSLSLAIPETGKALGPMTVNPEKFDDWYEHLPKKDISLLSPEGHQADEVKRKAVAPASSPAVAAATATRSKKIAKPITIKRGREKNSLAPQSEATVIKQLPRATPEKLKSAPPYLQDLPSQVQEEIPKLLFAGHAYAVDPAQRMIIINGKIMREGDRLDAMTKLAEITWEGVIIDRKGVRFQVRAH